MAVTSIWAITGRMDKVISYVKNPEKTVEKPELLPEAVSARTAVGDVIDYAENGDKTEQMMFVTGINCSPDTAIDDFMRTKLMWGKTSGRLAYHGYQSFLEGDGKITAEKAHEIGVKLAQELWGDRFEVVVATHLNTGHYHNHFVLNSVSIKDGYKYHRTLDDYRQMKMISDRLCREAKLHVVEKSSIRRGKNYSEWSAEKEGRFTVRGMIRADIDHAISISYSEKDFADTMKEMGYEFKFYSKNGSELVHPGIKPPGAKSYYRFSGLGENYEFDTIRRRIIMNSSVPGTPLLIEKSAPRKWEPPKEDIQGLPLTYKKYCIRLYAYVCKPKKKEYIPMALREDIIKLDNYIAQMDFLYSSGISNKEGLQQKKAEMQNELFILYDKKKELYSYKKWAKRNNRGGLIGKIHLDIKDVSRQIRELKKKIELCDEVFVSADDIYKKLNAPDRKPEPVAIKSVRKRSKHFE